MFTITPTCPNTPEFKPLIDDPINEYYYDTETKQASLVLEEVIIEGKLTQVNMFKMDTPKREELKTKGSAYAKVLVETPYFEYVPQTEVPVFDLVIAMKALVKRADKAKENPTIAEKSNFNGLDALRALVA